MNEASARFEGAMAVYGRNRLGKCPKDVTIPHWAAAALAKDGKAPPKKMAPLAWCRANWDYIMEEGKRLGAFPSPPKVKANARIDGDAVSSILMRFIQVRIGKKQVHRISLYEVVSDLLDKEGIKKPEEVSFRNHVLQHVCSITEMVKKSPIPEPTKKIKNKKQKSQTTKRSVFQYSIDPKTSEFLATYEWRRVRMEALKKYGPRCMCCGATPATGAVMHVDHIKPRKTHPQLALDVNNLQILCEQCNHGKGNWDSTDWRPR